ncbi:MAG: NADH-quinone oxidoreductase subunit M, partial [Proteobacteria bacterium]|nr:NADH-quinone oxidoreductase subunit M [Pseudomonadota bacterium]
MSHFPLLSGTIFLPLVGALFILLFVRGDDETAARNAKATALWTSIAGFILSLCMFHGFDPSQSGFQLVEQVRWMKSYNISYHVGVDGISIYFIMLTTFLMPFCLLAGWNSIEMRVKEYMVAFLVLETLMIGVFAALDMVVFYFFFEAVLIPMYLIIGIWGSDNRVYAAFKFFLYTLAGSVLLLLAMLYMYDDLGTMSIPEMIAEAKFPLNVQKWLFLALFASFAVKVPMWPFHTWLPDAHVQAPTAGSMVLAGILIKMGAYGFMRFSLPMLPEASHYFVPLIYTLSIIAVVYTSLVALVQEDMKKLIAYSSVAHMGFVTLGIFSFNEQGMQGALFQMISHGLVSPALFFAVGVLYDRMHTKQISAYGGLVERMPSFALMFMVFTMASIGLPGTSGFVGEFLVLTGLFRDSTWAAFFAATGVVLGAAYMLWLYR